MISKQQTEGQESNVQPGNMNLVWSCFIGSRHESLIKSYPEIVKKLTHWLFASIANLSCVQVAAVLF